MHFYFIIASAHSSVNGKNEKNIINPIFSVTK